ncbi:MAG: LTA synthase family protein [Gemmatimonadales bacterium]|nr:LTA synthase family protein [Gemmatimonadales bacterium]
MAAWLTYAGTLPLTQARRIAGPLIQAMLWMGLYLGLAAAYRQGSSGTGHIQRVWFRVGTALLLSLASTHALRLLWFGDALPLWRRLYYLRFVLPVAAVTVFCLVILARENAGLLQVARQRRTAALLSSLVGLLTAAVFLACGADAGFEWASPPSSLQQNYPSRLPVLVTNVTFLFCVLVLVFALSSRARLALLLVAPTYALLCGATYAKLTYMRSAVQPLDLLRIPELVPQIVPYFGAEALLGGGLLVAGWASAVLILGRARPTVLMPNAVRVILGVPALGVVLSLTVALAVTMKSRPAARLVQALGMDEYGQWRDQARRNGILLSFLSELPSLFVVAPPDYSASMVMRSLRGYRALDNAVPAATVRPGVNLVVYMVESLMDPDDLALRFTYDPMPNLRAARKSHTGGHAIVPEQFGGSANSEFELLAGMSQSFLPQGSLPYRQYVRRPIPSLPRALHEVGYVTTAIQADPRYFYDRERVYPLLGFDRVVWAEDGVEAERKSRVGYPVDDVLVDAVIEASRGPRPFFIFAFPSSTHGPYDTGAYRASDLEVVDTLESTAAEEIKEYINALSAADRSIGTLIEHFSSQRDSTIIVVVGDHLPPLSQSALRHLEGHETATDAREAAILVPHRVPLLVWTSFGLPREEPELGLNVLASYILERMGPAACRAAGGDRFHLAVPPRDLWELRAG